VSGAWVMGIGKTKFGPTQKSTLHLAHEAIIAALDDAGIGPDELDAIVVANFLGGPNEGQLHLNSVVAGLFPDLHIPAWRVESACASGGVAVHNAVALMGTYPRILVVGVERMSDVGGLQLTRNIAMAGDRLLDQTVGLTFPASYALVAQAHMTEHGTTLGDLDLVSLKNHANARLNPLAHFSHKTVTLTEIEAGPTIASPLRLYDCCPVSDGAAAVVLSSTPGSSSRDIAITGSAVAVDAISLAQRRTLTGFPAAAEAARKAYAQAGITPADVDLVEVHDCFTIAEIVAMSDLGLASPAEALRMIRNGETYPEGALPVNASGGLKAGGHAIGATGVGQICELVKQLRGEASSRQVLRARRAVAHNVGGVGGSCAVHVLEGRS
jgi:acetyl-CoA C-acetyltransferase